jgi:DNA-binding response OmpR family regulator
MMTKPYDVQELVARFKAAGLDLAEDAAKAAFQVATGWLKDSVKASSTPFDDVVLVVLPKLEETALKAIDGIDGKAG